ncbi:MAG: glucose-1-phosphate thymidylyltransferase [FCB group bacterium]|nr:glucose-1-phosphate thymidylyltransferase [FCB group bacterium]
MKALITAGGHGTRLRPITHTQNKHLIPIANKLMLQYALEYSAEAGIQDVGVIINAGDTSIERAFGSGESLGLRITYIPQSAPKGLAHVVKIAESFIGDEPFIFYLGDNILVGGVQRFVDEFQSQKTNCHLVLSKVPDPNRFGVAELDGNRIISIEEKPSKPKSDFAVTGIYLYDSSIFKAVNSIQPSTRGELEISDAHQYLLEKGFSVSFSEITGWWKDTGKPEDLLEANRLVLDSLKNSVQPADFPTTTVSGRVSIGKQCAIENSIIRGPAIIGESVTIKNAYIGPYTSIGNQCEIQNSEIEYSVLMEGGCIRDLNQRVSGSLFGQNVLVKRRQGKPNNLRFMLGDQSHIELI